MTKNGAATERVVKTVQGLRANERKKGPLSRLSTLALGTWSFYNNKTN